MCWATLFEIHTHLWNLLVQSTTKHTHISYESIQWPNSLEILCLFVCLIVCLFVYPVAPSRDTHLGPDGLKQNAQARLKSLYKHAGQFVYGNVKREKQIWRSEMKEKKTMATPKQSISTILRSVCVKGLPYIFHRGSVDF